MLSLFSCFTDWFVLYQSWPYQSEDWRDSNIFISLGVFITGFLWSNTGISFELELSHFLDFFLIRKDG